MLEGAWNVQATPKKLPDEQVYVNLMDYFDSETMSNGFCMKLIEREDDVNFAIRMLEDATFDGKKVQFSDPSTLTHDA